MSNRAHKSRRRWGIDHPRCSVSPRKIATRGHGAPAPSWRPSVPLVSPAPSPPDRGTATNPRRCCSPGRGRLQPPRKHDRRGASGRQHRRTGLSAACITVLVRLTTCFLLFLLARRVRVIPAGRTVIRVGVWVGVGVVWGMVRRRSRRRCGTGRGIPGRPSGRPTRHARK